MNLTEFVQRVLDNEYHVKDRMADIGSEKWYQLDSELWEQAKSDAAEVTGWEGNIRLVEMTADHYPSPHYRWYSILRDLLYLRELIYNESLAAELIKLQPLFLEAR